MFMKKVLVAAAVTALATAGTMAGPVSPASAKTVIFCVKKKGGDVVQPKKKKCKKGWKKVKVNSEGPTGPQGPAGPQLAVKDATGASLGAFMGFYSVGALSKLIVQIDGGIYLYSIAGYLQPADDVYYKTADCTGTAYARAWPEDVTDLTGSPGSSVRLVERTTRPTFGPAKAFKTTSTQEAITAPVDLYFIDWTTSTCTTTPSTATDGALFVLQQVPAPADHPGPLTVG